MEMFIGFPQNIIFYLLLLNFLLINVNSLDILREYYVNRKKCLNKKTQYFECLSKHRNQRVIQNPKQIQFFSSIENNWSSPYCGKQLFESKIASFSNLDKNINFRIVGGVQALKSEFPWMASLQKKSHGKFTHYCGGVIISDYYILTAAHCADVFVGQEGNIRIRIGTDNLEDGESGTAMSVSEIIVHEGWQRDININDIALYRTDRPIKYTLDKENKGYSINSICLPQETDKEPDFALVAGWGQMSTDTEAVAHLQKVVVPKFPHENCKINYAQLGTVNKNMFCYGGEGEKDSCLGDSGGPLIEKRGSKFFVIGIVSYGVPCAISKYPTIYTKITRYLNWIYSKIKI